MNVLTLLFGVSLILFGFVTMVRKVHDRSLQESVALLKDARYKAPVISALALLIVPIVSAISGGIAILALGVILGR
jgi:uncharacterized membrane protein YdjX (TVP38/TMEM64 family)